LLERCVLATLGQREGDHAGDDEDEHWQELEEGGADRPPASLSLIRSAEDTLDNVLVGTPVPQTHDRGAEEHAEPGVVVVEIPGHPPGLADRRPRALDARRDHGLPEVEHLRADDLAEFGPAAQGLEPEDRHQDRAEDQDDRLEGLRVGDGAEAAQDGVQAGEDDHEDRADPEAVEVQGPEVQVQLGQQGAEDHSAGEDADRDLGQDVRDQRDQGEHPAAGVAEPLLQELRHREHAGPHVERHEPPRQNQQAPGVQFVVRHRDAVRAAGTRQSDEVFRADVAGKNRRADDEPA